MTYPGCCTKCGFNFAEHREGGDAEFCARPKGGQREAAQRAVAAAAVLLLAAGARECLPEAKRINLSDQGEWLRVDDIDGIDTSDESQPELRMSFDDRYGHTASHLSLAHLDASPYLHANLDGDNGRYRYYIDIQEALS